MLKAEGEARATTSDALMLGQDVVTSPAPDQLTRSTIVHDRSSSLDPLAHDAINQLNPQIGELTLVSRHISVSEISSSKAHLSTISSFAVSHVQPKGKSNMAATVGQHIVITSRAKLGIINRSMVDDTIVLESASHSSTNTMHHPLPLDPGRVLPVSLSIMVDGSSSGYDSGKENLDPEDPMC